MRLRSFLFQIFLGLEQRLVARGGGGGGGGCQVCAGNFYMRATDASRAFVAEVAIQPHFARDFIDRSFDIGCHNIVDCSIDACHRLSGSSTNAAD
jgi:hypothetical protein